MSEPKQKVISIKRPNDSTDGKVINYLQSHPFEFGMDLPELVMFTLKVYWLPMTLISLGVRGERLKQTGIWVIGHLEAQISSIRRMCEIDNDPVAINSLIKPQIAITASSDKASILGDISQTRQLNSDNYQQEDELIQMEVPEEVKQANRMLGWNG
ncbi:MULTISPECIES: hypothetical protein [Nostoc]|uniref:Uncharacterized protein n=1 Tax=Nostoc paludosum FACHB-159 TaxID=2692908 RepID=A0ABR8KN38_9NOSO|nr:MULTISPECIES: hypothetical protein [Nostoc]MBD2682987.1 hypothetical protein [Nostoc sp. FACHB-857]MBD2739327.1 hypothetical protein [Nostoc paludosum FACHB-159]